MKGSLFQVYPSDVQKRFYWMNCKIALKQFLALCYHLPSLLFVPCNFTVILLRVNISRVLKTFPGFPPRSINYRSDYPGPSTFQVAHSNFTSGTIMDKFEDPDAHFKSSWTYMRI